MITIQILGLDPYVVGHYSKEHTSNLAQLFEVEEDQLSFYAHSGMMFHLGVEQTSWDTLVIVRAPKQVYLLEEAVTDYIFKTLTKFSINVTVQFNYFEPTHSHSKINDQYPRFIGPDQVSPSDDDYDDNDVVLDSNQDEDIDPSDEESIYLGNAFEGFEDALDKAYEKKKN